ncbi:MAG: hypothetical protein Tsb0021_12650 [Chlamydiales bacterium]
MSHLDHEKLDVYQASIDLVVFIDKIIEALPRGKGYIVDQFQRAAISVPLNIAEGAGEFSNAEKGRFYRMAKRSATECAGIFDICFNLRLIKEEQYQTGRNLILRIVSMLTKMAKSQQLISSRIR